MHVKVLLLKTSNKNQTRHIQSSINRRNSSWVIIDASETTSAVTGAHDSTGGGLGDAAWSEDYISALYEAAFYRRWCVCCWLVSELAWFCCCGLFPCKSLSTLLWLSRNVSRCSCFVQNCLRAYAYKSKGMQPTLAWCQFPREATTTALRCRCCDRCTASNKWPRNIVPDVSKLNHSRRTINP